MTTATSKCRSAKAFEQDWKKVLEARKKEEEGEGDSEPEGPPILAVAVEPPSSSAEQQPETANRDQKSDGEQQEATGSNGARVCATVVERPSGNPSDQTEATTSGDACFSPWS